MKLKKSPLLFLATLALSAPAAHAVDRFWEGNSGGTWSSNVNWTNNTTTLNSGSVVPLAADDVFFHMTGTLGGSGTSVTLQTDAVANSILFRQSQTFTVSANTVTSGATNARKLTIGTGGISKTGTGSVTINGNGGTTGIITLTLGSNTSQTWSNSSATALNVGTGFISGTSTAAVISLGNFAGANANTLTLNGTGNFNFGAATTTNAVITGSTGSLIKNGAGTVTIGGVNTYGGTTTISGGKLALTGTGSIANTQRIIVGASTTFDVTGLTASSYTLGASQTVGGPGTILATDKTFVANGTLSPGSSPGTLTQDGGNLQLGVGGDYNWQIHDATGAAGTGYDTTNLINGATLDLSLLSAGNTYNINLWSLSGIGPDVNGNAINFNNAVSQSWTLFSTGTAISGFNTNLFTINTGIFNGTDGFDNDLGGGVFSVGLGDSNTDLVLNFTAVPEPGAAFLGSLGLLALLRRRR